jgi:hypothetical protein
MKTANDALREEDAALKSRVARVESSSDDVLGVRNWGSGIRDLKSGTVAAYVGLIGRPSRIVVVMFNGCKSSSFTAKAHYSWSLSFDSTIIEW